MIALHNILEIIVVSGGWERRFNWVDSQTHKGTHAHTCSCLCKMCLNVPIFLKDTFLPAGIKWFFLDKSLQGQDYNHSSSENVTY